MNFARRYHESASHFFKEHRMHIRLLGRRGRRIVLAALTGIVSTLLLASPAPAAASEQPVRDVPLCCSYEN